MPILAVIMLWLPSVPDFFNEAFNPSTISNDREGYRTERGKSKPMVIIIKN